MAQWVLSVAGIAILSVLADVILPDGQTRKYIKTVIGIVVTLVLVQPVITFLSGNRTLPTATATEVQPQQQYLQYLQEVQRQDELQIAAELADAGFSAPVVTYSQGARRYFVNLSEPYSAERHSAAILAVQRAKCKYAVEFFWHKTE